MGNDAAVLKDLVGLLNDPRITGAKQEQSSVTSPASPPAPPLRAQEPAQAMDVPLSPHQKKEAVVVVPKLAPPPPPASSHTGAPLIFFTGHPKVGKSYLANLLHARVIGFDDPIFAMASETFGEVEDKSLLKTFFDEVRAWGDGDRETPFTAARAMFTDAMRSAGGPLSGFGAPGFWAARLLDRVAGYRKEFPKELIAVTDIRTPDQYQLLKGKGFRPYHVSCHAATRAARGAAPAEFGQVAATIERSITQALSKDPGGKKLWCIWNDSDHGLPSNRLMSLAEFLAAYQ